MADDPSDAPIDLAPASRYRGGRRRRPPHDRRLRPRRAGRDARHTALRVRRGRAARPLREYRVAFGDGAVAYAAKAFLCVAMARLVAEEGLDLDVATGGRGARRAPGRASRPTGWCSTATTSRSSSCGSRSTLGRRPARRRRRRRARSHRGARGERPPAAPGAACGSRPASRRTRTSTSPPAPTTRSSGSPCRAAPPTMPRCGRRRATRWSCRLPLPHRVADPRPRAVRARRPIVGRARRRSCAASIGEPIEEINLGGGLGCRTPPTTSGCARRSPSSRAFVRDAYAAALHGGRARSRAAAHGRGRAFDRRAGGDHALHGRHGQGDRPACARTWRSTAA